MPPLSIHYARLLPFLLNPLLLADGVVVSENLAPVSNHSLLGHVSRIQTWNPHSIARRVTRRVVLILLNTNSHIKSPISAKTMLPMIRSSIRRTRILLPRTQRRPPSLLVRTVTETARGLGRGVIGVVCGLGDCTVWAKAVSLRTLVCVHVTAVAEAGVC